jgi:5-methylthioadenosine/S-adenosylhomocysteine deaminase
VPISSPPIADGAIAVEGETVVAVGSRSSLTERFSEALLRDFGEAAIIPGLINAHSHLELTAMRGYLDNEESDFFAWLRKLTVARLERMTQDDLHVSALWGACEAVRAGVTCVGDSSDSAYESMRALRQVGLRGIVFQESFGPDPRLVEENFEKLKFKVSRLRELESALLHAGISPHAPYTVCGPQLELIADYARAEKLPVMMHAAESTAEELFMREGRGPFAEGLTNRGIPWRAPQTSTIDFLGKRGILRTRPLLAHCINVDDRDIAEIRETGTRVVSCPKSNAKLGHGRAPLAKFLEAHIGVGLGSDSVASNNICDLLEEARFAILMARAGTNVDRKQILDAQGAIRMATIGGAKALGLEGLVGELREGLPADFAVVALEAARQLPAFDPVSTLIFASSGRDVVFTAVAGKEVYGDGEVRNVDEQRLRARMKEIAEKLG